MSFGYIPGNGIANDWAISELLVFSVVVVVVVFKLSLLLLLLLFKQGLICSLDWSSSCYVD